MNQEKSSRILTIVDGLSKGGVHRNAQLFAQGYQKIGMDSRVFALKKGGIREHILSSCQIPYWLFLTKENLAEIENWDPAFIHIHSHGFDEHDYRKLTKLFPGRIVFEKNVFSKPKPWTHEMSVSLQMSAWCDWRFRQNLNAKNIRTAIIPNVTNSQAFYKASDDKVREFKKIWEIPLNAVLIGRVGQSNNGKWSTLLIDVFEKLCSKVKIEFHLLVVNAPTLILNRIERSLFRKRITVIDEVLGDDNLSVVYSAIDIFALIAENGESFGNVLAESMLCQTPVVALSTPWAHNSQCEVVGNMEGGLIATTPDGFYNAVLELATNNSLRKELGEKGRLRIINKYDYINVARDVLKVIQSNFSSMPSSELQQKILSIYTNTYDNPNFLTIEIIKSNKGKLLPLTRYTTGYESVSSLPKRVIKVFLRNM
ncbi:glycosyltransferase family 4 protein [Trichothermofontia sp.]